MIIVFAWACKAQLNGRSLVHAEGPALVARGMLEQAELDAIGEQAGWQPHYCLDVLRAVMSEAWRREGGTTLPSEATRTSAYLALESLYVELAKAIGGAIRVKATGLPSSYDNFLYLLVGIFFVVAPLAWGNVAGWSTPVICTVVFIVIRTLMVLGDALEDPFGEDITDHPLGKFCKVVELQCKVVYERHLKAKADPLHLPPSKRPGGGAKAPSDFELPAAAAPSSVTQVEQMHGVDMSPLLTHSSGGGDCQRVRSAE